MIRPKIDQLCYALSQRHKPILSSFIACNVLDYLTSYFFPYQIFFFLWSTYIYLRDKVSSSLFHYPQNVQWLEWSKWNWACQSWKLNRGLSLGYLAPNTTASKDHTVSQYWTWLPQPEIEPRSSGVGCRCLNDYAKSTLFPSSSSEHQIKTFKDTKQRMLHPHIVFEQPKVL